MDVNYAKRLQNVKPNFLFLALFRMCRLKTISFCCCLYNGSINAFRHTLCALYKKQKPICNIILYEESYYNIIHNKIKIKLKIIIFQPKFASLSMLLFDILMRYYSNIMIFSIQLNTCSIKLILIF